MTVCFDVQMVQKEKWTVPSRAPRTTLFARVLGHQWKLENAHNNMVISLGPDQRAGGTMQSQSECGPTHPHSSNAFLHNGRSLQ